MTESAQDRPAIAHPLDERTGAKREWIAPKLTKLGDIEQVTQQGGGPQLDGNGLS